MLEYGIARSDGLRLGPATDGQDRVIAPDGGPWPGLFTPGPVAMGRLFEIVAVPDPRVQCASVAQSILNLARQAVTLR